MLFFQSFNGFLDGNPYQFFCFLCCAAGRFPLEPWRLAHPEFPEPLGVLYKNETREPYDRLVHAQVREAIETKGRGDLATLLQEGDTWIVEDD